MVKTRKDLTGEMFGSLLVIKQAEDYVSLKGTHYACWECECQCDKHTRLTVIAGNLIRGKTKSCGCYRTSDDYHQDNFQPNLYDLSNEYGIGYLKDGTEFYFSLEDYDIIKQYRWSMDNNGYLTSQKNGIKTRIHKLIMPNENSIVDHINRNKLDNRRENLRYVTKQENFFNSDLYDKILQNKQSKEV